MKNTKQPFHLMAKPAGPDCNLSCRYCFYLEKEAFYKNEPRHRMSEETLEQYISQYCQSQDTPELVFAWQGGEPTLMGREFFERAVTLQKKHAGGRPVQNAFQTNGLLLDNDWCKFLKREKFLVGLSLDGPRHIHDRFRVNRGGQPTFDKVLKVLKRLKCHGVDFNTLTCVTRQSSPHGKEIYEFLKSAGSTFMQFIPIVERKPGVTAQKLGLKLDIPPDFAAEDVDPRVMPWTVEPLAFGKFLCSIFDCWVRKDVGHVFVQIFDAMLGAWMGRLPALCIFGETCGNAFVMEHNGDVYACDHFVYPEFFLGNIHQTPLTGLMGTPAQTAFAQKKRIELPTQCRQCQFFFACHGECPKHRFLQTETGEHGLNWLCDGYRHFMQHIDPYMHHMADLLRAGRPAAEIMRMPIYSN
jgi:uncharacterized protein